MGVLIACTPGDNSSSRGEPLTQRGRKTTGVGSFFIRIFDTQGSSHRRIGGDFALVLLLHDAMTIQGLASKTKAKGQHNTARGR